MFRRRPPVTVLRHPGRCGRVRPVVALAWAASGCFGAEPSLLTLDDVPDPDTNTAVVLLDRTVHDGSHVVLGAEPAVYDVNLGLIPHTLSAARAYGADTASLTVVVSDLYAPGPVTTDGQLNRVAWTGPGGTTYEPAVACTFEVVQPFTLSGPSLQRVQFACLLLSSAGDAVIVLAKTSRYKATGGATAGR